ncbi:hypothetical protein ICW40_18735 [Actinotalea ferrariae]|uniref:DUF6912 family protein n=1 Tax=Actinotalea ferrariae TaxID=1386098 RepID=UPI001C8BE2B2|nr:hypothetical protein [Actinotalea ferrariae]MBX9246830.1 hypothetical protein [Actinotalea ferrariae]
MRIYLPSSLDELGSRTRFSPRVVHAVTPGLRSALPDEDEEGLEYAAQLLAADDSLDTLDTSRRAGRRRVVVAADVPDAVVDSLDPGDPGTDGDVAHAPSAVRLTSAVGWDDIACAHVDEAAAEADVVAAAAGDEAALERLAERDLLWYDVSELGRLAASVKG